MTDLIRRGDAREILEDGGFLERSLERLAALPAVTVGVKPLEWQLHAANEGVYYSAFDPLYGREVEAPNEATCDAIDQSRTARILAALEPVAAPDPAAIREAHLAFLNVDYQVQDGDEFTERAWEQLRAAILALTQKGAAE